MPIAEVDVANRALVLLGEEPLNSLTDHTGTGVVMDTLFEHCYLDMLSQHPWRCAIKIADLVQNTEDPQYKDWKYAYQLPEDVVVVHRVTVMAYEIYENVIYANDTDLKIEYTYRVPVHELPQHVLTALVSALAAMTCRGITQKTELLDEFIKIAARDRARARNIDCAQRPNVAIQDDFGVVSRRFGPSSGGRGATWYWR